MNDDFCIRDWAGFCHMAIVCGVLRDGCKVDSQEAADDAWDRTCKHYAAVPVTQQQPEKGR